MHKDDAAIVETEPKTAVRRIEDDRCRVILVTERGPWRASENLISDEMDQAVFLIADPELSWTFFGDAVDDSSDQRGQRATSLALEDAVPTAATDEAPPLWTTEQPSQGIQTS